ncbi:DUF885 family protein [Massilia sp. TS11]|uniref:DUF885 domain-containing protein n=1 Tax=Massilia sp. TS11 TaxID=2908003 RepID=UPI001EDA64FB|nr:DUF885 domain-containing protein [Massilia sp. TS11]MCG2585755.1 DUF885 domain-containing protein [Massilia sp. TS11]
MRARLVFLILLLLSAPLLAASPAEQARALFEADWQWRLRTQPEFATSVGDHRYDDKLSDTSLAASLAAAAHDQAMLAQARAIERRALPLQEQISLDLFIYEKSLAQRAAAFYPYNWQPITTQDGLHLDFVQMAAQMPFASERDYRNYFARIQALPRYVDGLIAQLREGLRSGWTTPQAVIKGVPAQLRQLRKGITQGPLATPFRRVPAGIAQPARDRIASFGPQLLQTVAAPALRRLEQFIEQVYLPATRSSLAASALPGGADYYALLAEQATTTALTPAEIHAIGLREVARLQGELRGAIARTGFSGSYSEFVRYVTSDPRFFFTDPEALLAAYRSIIARASQRLPQLFWRLPQEAVEVRPIQYPGAEEQSAAFYEAGIGGDPGAFVVNTTRLHTRAKWEMETLALHEAVPGHHTQVARAHELSELPPFRRHGWYVAFGEGWALYAEGLGYELGLFSDPYADFGHLNDELLRAVRLVVDTGIHAFGWSRQQALDYMNANSANPPGDNEVEVDRYIGWPGQALGYKIGQMKILELRQRAQSVLGARFDLRRFHNAVIDNGPLPLGVLEQQIERWITQQNQ